LQSYKKDSDFMQFTQILYDTQIKPPLPMQFAAFRWFIPTTRNINYSSLQSQSFQERHHPQILVTRYFTDFPVICPFLESAL